MTDEQKDQLMNKLNAAARRVVFAPAAPRFDRTSILRIHMPPGGGFALRTEKNMGMVEELPPEERKP